MAIPKSEYTKYRCDTQKEEDPSFGPAPSSNLAGTTGANDPDQEDSIVVGYGIIVPRWDVTPPGGRKLLYFVRTDLFPSPSQAKAAAQSFQDAADSWNAMKLGVVISQTTDQASANFYLVYKVNPTTVPPSTVLARAFFPHEVDQDVIVFTRAYDPNNFPILKNIFQHEIGHILGLRHEFAIEGDPARGLPPEGNGAVLFGEKNPISIMSYNFPPEIQDSDRVQVAQFYKLANGFMISGRPVTDFQSQLRHRDR